MSTSKLTGTRSAPVPPDSQATILEARLDKSAIRRVYERLAPMYDFWAHLTEAKARRRCLEIAAVREGESVLEVAVGTGIVFAELVRANPSGKNEGLDLTEGMLARARARLAKQGVGSYHLQVADAYDLPFPDRTFDVVVNNYMFDLLPEGDFARVLGEMRRVLVPGGRLVLVNMTKGDSLLESLAEAVYRFRPEWMGGCRSVSLSPHLERAGFVDVKRELVTQMTFPSEVVSARRAAADLSGSVS